MPKLKFSNPENNQVVILHYDDYWIKKLILKDMPSTTLELYPTSIHVTPVLIARTLSRLRLINWLNINKKSILNNLFRQIYAQYVLACIDQIEAKVVLTLIDNSSFFQNLSRIDHKRTYFAIQNGARTLSCVRDSLPFSQRQSSTISMTNFFCFGRRDVDLFSRHGHKVDAYFPVGSLIGGYYKSVVSVPIARQHFDLCLISQWHEHHFGDIVGDDFAASVSRMVGAAINSLNLFMLRLLKETGLSLVICPRNDHDAAELSFYKDTFGEKVRIAASDRKDFSTYRIVEQSQLAIALNSTTLGEVFSWGQKVLWCNVPNNEHYEMPEAGICYFHGNDYSAFKELVLTLLKMPQEEYEMRTREGAHYINNYDPANPPHEIIRSAVIKALANTD